MTRDARQDVQKTSSQAHAIVTQDSSELARTLRARGWVVRAGWRSTHRGESVWLVRLVDPSGSWIEPALSASVEPGFGLAA
jgi:hypothetical protein